MNLLLLKIIVLRYFNFDPSLKIGWCITRDFSRISISNDHKRVWSTDLWLCGYLTQRATRFKSCMVWWVIRLQCNHEVPPNSKIATGGVLRKRCSLKFRNIHRRTLGLESLFNKVADLQACKLIKKRLIHVFSCDGWYIAKFWRTSANRTLLRSTLRGHYTIEETIIQIHLSPL